MKLFKYKVRKNNTFSYLSFFFFKLQNEKYGEKKFDFNNWERKF